MRIVVTGKNGQVASSLRELAADRPDIEMLFLGQPEFDLSQPDTITRPLEDLRPDVVISAAAYTAVDAAETDAEQARRVNADGVQQLARAAKQLGASLLHLSTDYVYSGDKSEPYVETDPTGPVSVYGETKLLGEQMIAEAADDHVILRTAWVYSPFGRNFAKTMLRLGESRDEVSVVADQRGCPTYAPDIAAALLAIAERVRRDRDPALRGVFHLTGQGEASWAEFAQGVFDHAHARGRRKVAVRPISTSEYPTPAVRPPNSRLSGEKLFRVHGLRLPRWQDSVSGCVDRLLNDELKLGAQ